MKLYEIADEDVPLVYKLLSRALSKDKRVIFYDYGRELCTVIRTYIEPNKLSSGERDAETMWIDIKGADGNEFHSKGYHIPMHIDQLELRPQKDGSLELADVDQEDHDREMGRLE
jgi:hypothetical protein